MSGSYMKQSLFCVVLGMCLNAAAQTDEEKVGKAAAAQVLGSAPLLTTSQSHQYVNELGLALAAHSGVVYKWRFGVIKSDAINAFAMPGG